MNQPFTLQNLYVAVTDNPCNKYRGVYHHNNMLYLLNVRGSTFNYVRDKLRQDNAPYEGMDLEEVLSVTAEHALHKPCEYVRDIFRVTSGNRVTPNYSGQGVYIAPSDGYTQHEILSMADQDFPLTMGASHHRSPDNKRILEEFQSELRQSNEGSNVCMTIQAETSARTEAVAQQFPVGVWIRRNSDEPATMVQDGIYYLSVDNGKNISLFPNIYTQPVTEAKVDPLAAEIEKYPAYWRKLPDHWTALDYYRVRELFPLPAEFQSARLDHALKKLLIPANRTGGKPFRKEMEEVYATLGQWLKDNPEV